MYNAYKKYIESRHFTRTLDFDSGLADGLKSWLGYGFELDFLKTRFILNFKLLLQTGHRGPIRVLTNTRIGLAQAHDCWGESRFDAKNGVNSDTTNSISNFAQKRYRTP